MLTHEAINKRNKDMFRFQAAIQGVDLPQDDDEPYDDGDDLPEQLLEIERKRKAEREEEKKTKDIDELKLAGFGHVVVK